MRIKEEFLSCVSYFQREVPEGTFSQSAGLFSCLLLVCLPKINGFVWQYSHLVDFEGLGSVQDKPWGHWKLKSPWKGYGTVGDHHEKQAKSTRAMLNPKWQCPGDIKDRGVPAGLALEFCSAFHGSLSSVSVHVPLGSCSFHVRKFLREGSLCLAFDNWHCQLRQVHSCLHGLIYSLFTQIPLTCIYKEAW